MHHSDLHFRIEKEQHAQMVASLQAIAVMFFAILTAALLPSLVVQYLFKDGQMPTSNPLILTYLPHVVYGASVLAFVWAFATNMTRSRRIRQYTEELDLMALSGCGCGCDCCDECSDEEVMIEMAPAEDMAEVKSAPARSTKKSAAKKSSKTARSTKK